MGHATGGELLWGHDAPAPGGRRATPRCPADESLARHLWLTWKEGQAGPRRCPQPFSRILTAWKGNSANFALRSNHPAYKDTPFGRPQASRCVHKKHNARRNMTISPVVLGRLDRGYATP